MMDFPRILLGACSGMKFYREALDWTPAEALKHLLKLALVVALIGAPIFLRNSYHWADVALDRLEDSKVLPEFSIEKGRVRTTLPQPHIRMFRDFALVLDTTSPSKPPKPAGANAGITITADSLLLWSELNPSPTPIDIAYFPDGRVDAAYLRGLLRESLWACGIFLGVLMFLGFFCGSLLQLAVFGGLAAFVEQGIAPSFRFDQLFCFGSLALTPSAVAVLVLSGYGVGFDGLSLAYMVVFALFFTGGTTACRRLLLPPGMRADEDE